MSDYRNVSNEQLLREFHVLQDEYIKMKKMYEDLFYNLDIDNLSPNFRLSIDRFSLTFSEVFPDGAKNDSAFTMTADKIVHMVAQTYETKTDAGNKYSALQTGITQTAESIKLEAKATYETKTDAGDKYETLSSSITLTAQGITTMVQQIYETKHDAGVQYGSLQSKITQTATAITQTVTAQYGNPITVYYPPPYPDLYSLYYYNGLYWYWTGSYWGASNNANFGTVFEQTAFGFKLRGNVDITGNLKITGDMITSGTITGTELRSVSPHNGFAVNTVDGRINFYDNPWFGYPAGGIYYDNNGTYPDNKSRLFFHTNPPHALKIQSGGNMSIEAPSGIIYALGRWEFSDLRGFAASQIRFGNGTYVDFTGATVNLSNATVIN